MALVGFPYEKLVLAGGRLMALHFYLFILNSSQCHCRIGCSSFPGCFRAPYPNAFLSLTAPVPCLYQIVEEAVIIIQCLILCTKAQLSRACILSTSLLTVD